jgi:hypothetical protein
MAFASEHCHTIPENSDAGAGKEYSIVRKE